MQSNLRSILLTSLVMLGMLGTSVTTLAILPAQAASSPGNDSQTATPGLDAGAVIQVAGKAEVLPKPWAQMTIADLAKIGIRPNMHNISEKPSGGVTPDSASGCNKNVCITVTGKGLRVNGWSTTGYNVNYDPFCTYSIYWVDGKVYDSGALVCGGLGTYFGELSYDIQFPAGKKYKLCNTWVQINGQPCETVHA